MNPTTTDPQTSPTDAEDEALRNVQKLHPMVVMQKGERLVATVKRHPFGIILLYVGAGVAIAIAALLALVFIPGITDQYSIDNVRSISVAFLLAVVFMLVVLVGLATTVYWQNEWIITTDSITQIQQRGLFTRQVSQLSMDNLEDVTVDQIGILPKIFNYGTLRAETAGERSKFKFIYCPKPNDYARQILEIHEKFLEDRRNVQNA